VGYLFFLEIFDPADVLTMLLDGTINVVAHADHLFPLPPSA
jgi:hypothetical protein